MSHLFTSAMQAKNYALFRPQYPMALYEKVTSWIQCPRSVALDVGCGTGLASLPLTEFFDSVIAIDPSEKQLSNAAPHDRILYQVGMESSLPAEDATVALVTAAQAAHWFEMDKFHREVDRVLMHGGVLAIWTYGLAVFRDDPLLQQMIDKDFYSGVLKAGGYWDKRNQHVEDRYSRIPCVENYKNERIEQGFDIQQTLSPDELTGYLRSWSAYITYCERNNIVAKSESDPIEAISNLLRSTDQYEKNGITVTWPVTLLLGRKEGNAFGPDDNSFIGETTHVSLLNSIRLPWEIAGMGRPRMSEGENLFFKTVSIEPWFFYHYRTPLNIIVVIRGQP